MNDGSSSDYETWISLKFNLSELLKEVTLKRKTQEEEKKRKIEVFCLLHFLF